MIERPEPGDPNPDQRGLPVERRPDGPPRRLTWLLAALLLLTVLLARTLPQRTSYTHVQSRPPAAVAATGKLADVYEMARPATLRIESRCQGGVFGRRPLGVGSGFFISPDGQVLTAYHVVRAQVAGPHCSLRYVGIDDSGREYPLRLVGFDAFSDLALMQARTDGTVPYLPLADRLPRVGTDVVAIGNSRGDVLGDRSGRITRLGVRPALANFASGTFELTAALAPGDSGGPVLDESGTALGVVSYISFNPSTMTAEEEDPLRRFLWGGTDSGYASYAVPVLAGSEQLAELVGGRQRDVPVIGFSFEFDYDPRTRRGLGLGSRPGVVVGQVQPGGPGEEAGLRSLQRRAVYDREGRPVGLTITADVITALDGTPTPSFNRLLELIFERDIGETVTLRVQRGRELVDLDVVLAGYRDIFP